ncbi:hypothetical protein FRB94_006151 [Tulasnella sp. JGI-2019a]|nr:hypothetical protein FRB94_006151 [Tulasnella sp. JGI-2019a]KAG9031244.1 hypothetical protein FRB95_002947 [Tulasnella sp. JGI-2019a]
MLTFQDYILRDKLKESVSPGVRDAITPAIDNFSFLAFTDVGKGRIPTVTLDSVADATAYIDRSTREDVAHLQEHPLVADKSKITEWVYNVKTGKVNQVV